MASHVQPWPAMAGHGRPWPACPWPALAGHGQAWPAMADHDWPCGKPRKVDSPKKNVKKPQDGRQKSGQYIENPYQMEDNRNPKGAARSAALLGRRRRRRLVVFHLVRISYVLASFPEPVLARFSTKFSDSENSLRQGACLKGLVGFAQ